MSVANLEQPNDLDLYMNSLTLSNNDSNMRFRKYRNYTINCSVTGPYATPHATTVNVTEMDNRVFIRFPEVIQATTITTNTIIITGVVPFPTPIFDTYFPVTIYSTNVHNNTEQIGFAKISSSGGMTINCDLPTTSYFGNSGYRSFNLCYTTTLIP